MITRSDIKDAYLKSDTRFRKFQERWEFNYNKQDLDTMIVASLATMRPEALQYLDPNVIRKAIKLVGVR